MIFVGKAFILLAEKVCSLGYEPDTQCLPSVRFKVGAIDYVSLSLVPYAVTLSGNLSRVDFNTPETYYIRRITRLGKEGYWHFQY